MGAPSGGVAKLFINPQPNEASFPTFNSSGVGSGLRIYFDKVPLDRAQAIDDGVQEIRGTNTYDVQGLFAGPSTARGSFSFPLRYSPVHAVLLGWAAGDLSVAGTTPAVFTAKTADALVAAGLLYQFPVGSEAVFSQQEIWNAKPARLLIRGTASGVVMCTIDFWADKIVHSETEDTSVPQDGNGYSPGYTAGAVATGLVLWNHATSVQFKKAGVAAVDARLTEWEVEITNPLDQSAYIGTSRKMSVPFRSGVRSVMSRFTIEQDTNYEEVLDAFGYDVADAMEAASLRLYYESGTTNIDWEFKMSNGYVVNPGGGVDGMGPQRQQVEMKHIYKSPSSELAPEPFQALLRHSDLTPNGSTDAYATYLA